MKFQKLIRAIIAIISFSLNPIRSHRISPTVLNTTNIILSSFTHNYVLNQPSMYEKTNYELPLAFHHFKKVSCPCHRRFRGAVLTTDYHVSGNEFHNRESNSSSDWPADRWLLIARFSVPDFCSYQQILGSYKATKLTQWLYLVEWLFTDWYLAV